MKIFTDDCPRCGIKSVAFTIEGRTNSFRWPASPTGSACDIAENWDAAGAMFRKTLDTSLKNKFPDLTGPLHQRIKEAEKQQKLTPELAARAHKIRLDGNDASHEETAFSEEGAQQLADFTKLVLLYLFTLPGMLTQARDNRRDKKISPQA